MKNIWKSKLFVGALLALAAIAAVVVVMVSIGRSGGNDLQEQLDLGKRYISELDYENAVIAYETALEIDPYCLEAYLGLADAYMALGQPDKAIEIMERAKEMLPQELDVYTQLADLYFSNGNMESYIKVLKEGYENTGSGDFLALLEDYETSQADADSQEGNTGSTEAGDEEQESQEQTPEAETEDVAELPIQPVIQPVIPTGTGGAVALVVPVETDEETMPGNIYGNLIEYVQANYGSGEEDEDSEAEMTILTMILTGKKADR